MNLHQRYIQGQKSKSNSNIELTFRCPLQCHQCFRSWLTLDSKDEKKIAMQNKIAESYDISIPNLRKLLDFFDDDISFCGQFSDPIYHPKFHEILSICT